MIEIEKKYRISEGQKMTIIDVLDGLGAEKQDYLEQKDTYFNVPGRDSYTTKECLRIRETKEKKEVTYKPATEPDHDVAYFAKQEVNVDISSPHEMEILLKDIGCETLVIVDKKRANYKLNKINISVDNIEGIGWFIELEYMESDEVTSESSALEAIENLEEKLGLNSSSVELKPYRDLVYEFKER